MIKNYVINPQAELSRKILEQNKMLKMKCVCVCAENKMPIYILVWDNAVKEIPNKLKNNKMNTLLFQNRNRKL